MKFQGPYLAVIELTNNCNLRCKHCYGYFDSRKHLPFDNFKNVCKQLYSVGVRIATLSGGEPLLLGEDIGGYIKLAKKYFEYINLTTNGTLINDANVKNLKGVTNVQVSLDGDRITHDFIRGEGSYKKVISALTILKNHKIKSTLMMTVSDYNFIKINKVSKIAKEFNISLGFERITNVGRGAEFLKLSKAKFKRLVSSATRKHMISTDPIFSINNRTKREYLLKNKIISGCSAGTCAIVIDPDLNVYPCVRLRLNIGSLKKTSLKNILKKSLIIKNLSDRNNLKGKCGECIYKYICGGCRATAYAEHGDYLGQDSDCFL